MSLVQKGVIPTDNASFFRDLPKNAAVKETASWIPMDQLIEEFEVDKPAQIEECFGVDVNEPTPVE